MSAYRWHIHSTRMNVCWWLQVPQIQTQNPKFHLGIFISRSKETNYTIWMCFEKWHIERNQNRQLILKLWVLLFIGLVCWGNSYYFLKISTIGLFDWIIEFSQTIRSNTTETRVLHADRCMFSAEIEQAFCLAWEAVKFVYVFVYKCITSIYGNKNKSWLQK